MNQGNSLIQKLAADFCRSASGFALLSEERSFFSLRKEFGRKISVEKEKSSEKVLDHFFERAGEKPILKSHPSVIDKASF